MSIQGIEANNSGAFLESIVEREARARGFHVINHDDSRDTFDIFANLLLIKHYPYVSMYGCRAKSEFLMRTKHLDIRIECKWQQETGSVDEKFPYLLANAKYHMPEQEIIILHGGNGARKSAIDWLRREAARYNEKIIRVFEIEDYRKWFKSFCQSLQ